MKKQTRLISLGLVLIALLLLAAVPAAARSDRWHRTDFTARGYVCELGPSAREWFTDDNTVWHFRNMIYETPLYSSEDRINGLATWRGNQDQNVITGDGRAWGTGVIETEKGTWQIVYRGVFSGATVAGYTAGHGINGLQGQVMYWESKLLLPPFPDPDACPETPLMALEITGYILAREGD